MGSLLARHSNPLIFLGNRNLISPGYLTPSDLLAECRAWQEASSEHIPLAKRELVIRLRQIEHEMVLRHQTEQTQPAITGLNVACWPASAPTQPHEQFDWLVARYIDGPGGRIPLPCNAQQLWSQHKYSILARDQQLYHSIGRQLADKALAFPDLADMVTARLLIRPTAGGIRNAVQHMWGYVSFPPTPTQDVANWSTRTLLYETQQRVKTEGTPYLWASTALSELMAWLD